MFYTLGFGTISSGFTVINNIGFGGIFTRATRAGTLQNLRFGIGASLFMSSATSITATIYLGSPGTDVTNAGGLTFASTGVSASDLTHTAAVADVQYIAIVITIATSIDFSTMATIAGAVQFA